MLEWATKGEEKEDRMAAAKERRVAIYCRVSTSTQSVDPQEAALREYAERRDWTVVKAYSDRAVSGMQDRRLALDALMKDCRRGLVDIVLVWKFDRFGRSTRHLVEALEEFRQLRIDFTSLTEAVDTSTPAGRMFFAMIAVFANFERDIIAERITLGLEEARRKGKRLGRPEAIVSFDMAKQMRADRTQGKLSLRGIARKHGVTLWRVQKLFCGVRTRA
jgi:DNA invertase Pin-like site-specific DNA recombinase